MTLFLHVMIIFDYEKYGSIHNSMLNKFLAIDYEKSTRYINNVKYYKVLNWIWNNKKLKSVADNKHITLSSYDNINLTATGTDTNIYGDLTVQGGEVKIIVDKAEG